MVLNDSFPIALLQTGGHKQNIDSRVKQRTPLPDGSGIATLKLFSHHIAEDPQMINSLSFIFVTTA